MTFRNKTSNKWLPFEFLVERHSKCKKKKKKYPINAKEILKHADRPDVYENLTEDDFMEADFPGVIGEWEPKKATLTVLITWGTTVFEYKYQLGKHYKRIRAFYGRTKSTGKTVWQIRDTKPAIKFTKTKV